MPEICVNLFGKFSVQRDAAVIEGFESRKVQELLSYLALYREQLHPREALAGVLWGDGSTAQSKKVFRHTLWQLSRALDSQVDAAEPVLLVESDWIQFKPQARVELDVGRFEQAVTSIQGVRGYELDGSQFEVLQHALNLYRGELLTGWYHDWCIYERERLQNLYLAMLDKVVGYCEGHGQYELGLDYGARVLRIDRARERTHRRMMRLYHLLGNRTGALRQYQACAQALAEELNVKPASSTQTLYEQIQADQFASETGISRETPLPEPPLTPNPESLPYLQAIHARLVEFQAQIALEIGFIEHLIQPNKSL